MVITSATAGTAKVGTPFAILPKPASDPQVKSEYSSSSASAWVLRSSLRAPVVEKRFAKEFMRVTGQEMKAAEVTRPCCL